MVELELPKLAVRVRFPSPAPPSQQVNRLPPSSWTPARGSAWRLGGTALDPVLGRQDDLQNALQQDGREEREGEGLAQHPGEVLH
jgi:hypothetical protein